LDLSASSRSNLALIRWKKLEATVSPYEYLDGSDARRKPVNNASDAFSKRAPLDVVS